MQGVWRVTIEYVNNLTIILQYFTVLNYELFCIRDVILLGARI